MSSVELALNILAEVTTTELSKTQNPQGLEENKAIAIDGSSVAKNARKDIENRTGKPAITKQTAAENGRLESGA